MRSLLVCLMVMAGPAWASAEDFSLVAFLKEGGKDRVVDPEAPGAGPEVGEATSALLNKIFRIEGRDAPVRKLFDQGFLFHVSALEAIEKQWEKPLGWRKGDGAWTVTVQYRGGGVAPLGIVMNARSGRMIYWYAGDPKIHAGDGSDDELTADERALAQAGLAFYALCIQHHETAPEKYRHLLHPSVRRSFKANLRPASRLLPPVRSDGSHDLQGVTVTLDGDVGHLVAMGGSLTIRLKRDRAAWLVLEMKEGGK